MSNGQQLLAKLHTVGLKYSTGFRACTFYLVFKEPAHSEAVFPARTVCSPSSGELTQNTEPSVSLSTPFFGVAPGDVAARSVDPSPQHPAPHCCGRSLLPRWSRATKARRTGLPATGRSQGLAASAAPSPDIQGGEAALCGDAGAPGKTFEISGKGSNCQPLILLARRTRIF